MIDTHSALKHFKVHDPHMAHLLHNALDASNPITLPKAKPESQWFSSIVSSITSQQISTKAAASIFGRLKATLGEITPEAVINTPRTEVRSCGLSDRKTDYIYHNANAWKTLPTNSFQEMSDEDIIIEMTKLYGIGRWTVEMFLMSTLARPDVFSYGDLGLMQGMFQNYPLKPHWNRKIEALVNSWSPHKTLSSLTLWYYKDGGPIN